MLFHIQFIRVAVAWQGTGSLPPVHPARCRFLCLSRGGFLPRALHGGGFCTNPIRDKVNTIVHNLNSAAGCRRRRGWKPRLPARWAATSARLETAPTRRAAPRRRALEARPLTCTRLETAPTGKMGSDKCAVGNRAYRQEGKRQAP